MELLMRRHILHLNRTDWRQIRNLWIISQLRPPLVCALGNHFHWDEIPKMFLGFFFFARYYHSWDRMKKFHGKVTLWLFTSDLRLQWNKTCFLSLNRSYVAVTFAGISSGDRGYLAGETLFRFGFGPCVGCCCLLRSADPIRLYSAFCYIKYKQKQNHFFTSLSEIGRGRWGSALAPQGHWNSPSLPRIIAN